MSFKECGFANWFNFVAFVGTTVTSKESVVYFAEFPDFSAAIIPFSYAHICQFFLDPQGTHFWIAKWDGGPSSHIAMV